MAQDSEAESVSQCTDATARYFRGDTVVVRDDYAHAILVYDAVDVPDAVHESDHHEIIHAPEGWSQ